ncbi:macro domain-containing protein [Rhodohalobacter mucosus]|uniref:AraC family transcriptional regulator n=1 Tax=Rhodohalobacter mucosus TaxID=2079485 RepID=A0A316TPP5_9BACT|nr:macro domain-containing protein [Rhodohalobacter mucosus]PWN06360.1 AraC family transcriptional regulator [Rhodohalobacter mucosus]
MTELKKPKITFCDNNPDVVNSLREAFSAESNVYFVEGNILDYARDTIFSPANSLGFMDGGVDHDYVRFFGIKIQNSVKEVFAARPEGFVPVGAAELVLTGHETIPRLILAPTMFEPMVIPSYNIFRSFRAALKKYRKLGLEGEIFTPGFGTGIGHVSAEDAAKMMLMAYQSVFQHNEAE